MELFALPSWLIVTAFMFGLVVSLLTGYIHPPERRMSTRSKPCGMSK